MKPFVFENPPLMQTEDGRILGEYLARQFLRINESIESDSQGMSWRGPWEDGVYQAYDVVTDDGWLAIANKETTEKPAPQPIGDQVNVIEIPGPETFSTNTVSAASLIVGTRYTLAQDVYLRAIRYQIPASMVGFTVSYWLVLNPTTNPDVRQLVGEFTIVAGDTGSWKTFPVGLTIIPDGVEFDVAGAFTPATGSTSFSYEWDYKRKNGNPPSGEIWHQSGNNSDQMRVHQNDSDDTNRSTDLDNIGPGSDILMFSSGQQWTVISASKSGSVYTFIVEPSTRANEDTSIFQFTYYGPLSMDYLIDANHYSTLSNVNGFLSTTGYDPDDDPMTLDQNAYGIDITVQDVLVSDDWDFMAYTSA